MIASPEVRHVKTAQSLLTMTVLVERLFRSLPRDRTAFHDTFLLRFRPEGFELKCSKCQLDYPEGMKFCGECGAKLEKLCPGCGHSNPPQFKFCGECGQPLAQPAVKPPKDLSFDEKLAKIHRYLPEGLTQKILSQRDRIERERKQVTVMFCDMEGFTPLAERLGPEGIYSLMDEVYEILIHKVNDFGGTSTS
jgi:hypothetical protein